MQKLYSEFNKPTNYPSPLLHTNQKHDYTLNLPNLIDDKTTNTNLEFNKIDKTKDTKIMNDLLTFDNYTFPEVPKTPLNYRSNSDNYYQNNENNDNCEELVYV